MNYRSRMSFDGTWQFQVDPQARMVKEEIEELIYKNYVDEHGLCEPIVDGIVDLEMYLQSKFKILWILKEPHDDVKDKRPSGGGWHYPR